MKKPFIILAAALMCCTVACKKDDNSNDNGNAPVDYSKAILGKWKRVSVNGIPSATNFLDVITITPNNLTISTVIEGLNGKVNWSNKQQYPYQLNGSTLTYNDTLMGVNVNMAISRIDNNQFFVNNFLITLEGGGATESLKNMILQKVLVDYAQPIVGLWEGVSSEGDTTYGNYNHRWEFRADGTYTYYSKDASGNWVPDQSNTLNEYNVDGDWLAFHWVKNGEHNYELWDITECTADNMTWHAIRQTSGDPNQTGTRFETTFTMRKVR